MSRILALWLVLAMAANCHAEVTFDWATVGNPGNAGDGQPLGTFGAVSDVYRISKHEVTNNQYTEFLNAVGGTDFNELYNSLMNSDARGGITRSGVIGSFTYTVKPGRGNNPVVFVSFFDSMRFVNWLENGQPTGAQVSGTTEDGVYTLVFNETRNPTASFFIPSEDEWHKAAFHKNDGVTGNYFDYATSSDTVPTSEPPAGGTNSANYFDETNGFAVTGSTTFDNAQNYLTDVGAYDSSPSPYGTFDQGGNVYEWNEAVIGPFFDRGVRGGSWLDVPFFLSSAARDRTYPDFESEILGLRVASIPEPSTGLLGLLAGVGLLMRRKRVA